MPEITLEVLPDESDNVNQGQNSPPIAENEIKLDDPIKIEDTTKEQDMDIAKKQDLLEYIMRNDGSVVCKLCGEILHSRTHWYRHKYKVHVAQPLNPSPLFQCDQCLIFFKSRKGYIGHLASRHSEMFTDASPVLSNAQVETSEKSSQISKNTKEDPELSIPKSTLPNFQINSKVTIKPTSDSKRATRSNKVVETIQQEWDETRSKEEKLVADIIDRVRKECEAQGPGVKARRGYTRRTTVMNARHKDCSSQTI